MPGSQDFEILRRRKHLQLRPLRHMCGTQKASPSEKELADGILYMLSLKSRTLKEITDTLAFPAKDIAGMVRFLLKEGKITYTDGLLSIK